MSGHSKWATIKHQKGAKDKARGKLFAKILRQVEVAAREGGGDPEANPTLRTMFQKARDASVPMDTIERAIKRGTGELEGVTYESITYEGYAPGGVAVLVEVLTDNRNRTGAEVRVALLQARRLDGRARARWRGSSSARASIARRPGGRRGRADARRPRRRRRGPRRRGRGVAGHHAAHRPPQGPHRARGGRAWPWSTADLTMLPDEHRRRSTTVEAAKKVLRLIDALDDHDDVQNVYANFDIPDDILEAVEA